MRLRGATSGELSAASCAIREGTHLALNEARLQAHWRSSPSTPPPFGAVGEAELGGYGGILGKEGSEGTPPASSGLAMQASVREHRALTPGS